MRAFVAIDLPAEIHQELGRRQEDFRKRLSALGGKDREINWVRPEGVHLTLKFLGEISEGQLNQTAEQLNAIPPFEKFEVEVRGFGFFPNIKRPRVFWAGLAAPPILAQLAAKVDAVMSEVGFAPENRTFQPHLTLARFRNPLSLPDLGSAFGLPNEDFMGRFEVSEFYLFESKLRSGVPAEYRKIKRFPPSPKLP